MATRPSTATRYFSQDFQWEDLRDEVERSQERRYLIKEFPDLLPIDRALKVLEIGCGTGSSVLPILRASEAAEVYACDCSDSALRRAHELVQSTISSGNARFFPFRCDISNQSLPSWLSCSACTNSEQKIHDDYQLDPSFLSINRPFFCIDGVDIVTMVFTLSSIPPRQMQHVIKECFMVLKPGGLVLFRDYGLYDMTMQRFPGSQKAGERLYRRCDGTLSYFFTREVLRDLFTKEGFIEVLDQFVCKLH